MSVDGVNCFLMGSLMGGKQGKVVSKRQRSNGVLPDLVSELWVVLDGIDDGVEDPDEDS